MLKWIIYILIIFIVGVFVFLFFSKDNTQDIVVEQIETKNEIAEKEIDDKEERQQSTKSVTPVAQFEKRITKKPFGIFIESSTSPVQPERFQGYHTGTDFEIFDDEIDEGVVVKAICGGEVMQKKYVSGYGGVLIQKCLFNGEIVTVLYGHLNIDTIEHEKNKYLQKDEKIGLLGKNKSVETDYERKHLHISVHKGEQINLRGYVDDEDKLKNWTDVCNFINC